ncbi:MAG: 3-dehydroquinate synthase [Steroidobacteraceae bacterium]
MTAALETLSVNLGERSYPILIGAGLLENSGVLGRHVPGRDLLLVSNTTVAPLYARVLEQGFTERRIVEVTLPDGESHKTLENVSRILDVLVANRFGRDCTVVALGGGVVGDMAGFAAACYQRGVAYVQVPTTLLAQVDSSVGGKTGVNHPGGKNLIGAFHQPVAVMADTATLATLADRELRAGLAEIIKYGLIRDAAFFAWLEESMDRLLAREPAALARAIRRSCEIKAEIVGRDEREQGERALLNLGHTFGHAIESATGYSRWLHGEAVGAGLAMAAAMSCARGTLQVEQVERVRALLARTGLPTAAPDVRAASTLAHMRIDKKVKAGRIRLVLLRSIGDAYMTGDYADDDLKATVAAHCG